MDLLKQKPVNRTVLGVGYNSGGKHKPHEKNKQSKAYSAWRKIIERCYCEKFQKTRPSYKGCSVADEWHDFQNFAEWYTNHKYYGLGYEVDKDLLFRGNKVYSATNCSLVPQAINNLTLDSRAIRGDSPQGVYLYKRYGSYRAAFRSEGKSVHIGYFKTQFEASEAYVKAKERHVKNTALKWANKIEWGVFVNLMHWTVYQD